MGVCLIPLAPARSHARTRTRTTHLAHSNDSVLASPPNALDVDSLGKVPDLLLGVDSVVVAAVSTGARGPVLRIAGKCDSQRTSRA